MSKEIKFRIYHIHEKKFICNYNSCIEDETLAVIRKDNCIVQEFSGMTDKNGKEIYEGDILCETMTDEMAAAGFESYIDQVIFVGGAFVLAGDGPLYNHTYSKNPNHLPDHAVIGNVVENPELLLKC
jgi:uncharacterized phage protein (TIGR01671 family)